MKPEDKIMQTPGIWGRLYKHRFEVVMFAFMLVGLLATAIDAVIPDAERFTMPAVFTGLVCGMAAMVTAVLLYLGWWLYVALFKMED